MNTEQQKWEQPKSENPHIEGGELGVEGIRLEKNLDELSANLEEVTASSPSRRERIDRFVNDNWFPLTTILVSGGIGMFIDDQTQFLATLGLGTGIGLMGQTYQNMLKRWKQEGKIRDDNK